MRKAMLIVGLVATFILACGGSPDGELDNGTDENTDGTDPDGTDPDGSNLNEENLAPPPSCNAEAYALDDNGVQVAEAVTDFGLKLTKKLAADDPDQDIFVSPMSMSILLGMLHQGAEGESETDLSELLGFPDLTQVQSRDGYRQLIDYLVCVDPTVVIKLANSFWYRDSLTVTNEFKQICMDSFFGDVIPADFYDSATTDLLNDWVEIKTEGLIVDLFSQPLPTETVFALINTVYFLAQWQTKFESNNAEFYPFYLSDGTVDQLEFMTDLRYLPMYSGDNYEAFRLPYTTEQFEMTVLLPDDGIQVNTVLADLSPAVFSTIFEDSVPLECQLEMPKFTLAFEQNLLETLIEMGLPIDGYKNVFEDHEGGWLETILHSTYVGIDETQTEAAAVSAGYTVDSEGDQPDCTIRVDRPFIFAIRDTHTGTLLFLGKAEKPISPEYY